MASVLHVGLVTLALASVAAGSLVLARCDEKGGLRGAPPQAERAASPIDWHPPVDVARGPAHAGPWRMNESSFLYVDDGTLAVGDADVVGVAWVDNSRKDVWFRTYTGNGRPAHRAVNVSQSPAVFSWLPRVVMAGARVFVLWQEIVFSGGSHGGEIFFARSNDAGKSFAPPVNLSNSKAGDGKGQLTREHWHNGSLDLLRLSDGTLIAAWTTYEGSLVVSRSNDAGAPWSPPVYVVRDDELPARAPALAASGTETLYLAWAVGRDPSAGIRLARSTDRGQSFGLLSSVGGGAALAYADAPKLAVDGWGTLHLAYSVSLDGWFGPYQVRYARATGEGGFEPPRIIAGPPRDPHGASFPCLGLDRLGNVYLSWDHHPEIRAAPRGLGFAYSENHGNSFAPPSVVPGTVALELGVNGSRQGKPTQKLGVEASGLVALVDSRFKDGEHSLVRLIARRRN